ncbi:MAG: cation:proton antiporter [Betaproteobacteria bacterium]|jgi:Kef-type K+ transport system membrane component KefB|nr:MAG: cation:proton antiporter [Betaproteobacteria bacterium]
MESTSVFMLTIGGILLLGLVTSAIGKRTFLPRVTLLLIFGAMIGSNGLDWIPEEISRRFELVADVALLMVGFLLGEKLAIKSIRQFAAPIMWISVSAALITTGVVSLGLMLAGVPTSIAVVLGCIAAATAPAAVLDVTMESGAEGPFRNLLLAIVAIDDAWALILFGFGVAIATAAAETNAFMMVLREIGGGVALGTLLGLPAAYLTGRLRQGQPILSEALGIVFVCGGLAIWLEVSFLIAAMVMGAIIANLAKHHEYPFHAIENIEWPFMVIFFVLAGATLEMGALVDVGIIGGIYIVCRAIGKVLGARIGSELARTDKKTKNWMGSALLPQAGVAIGMALVASNHLPEYRQMLLSVVIGSTVFFEIIGPIFTRLALKRVQYTSDTVQ